MIFIISQFGQISNLLLKKQKNIIPFLGLLSLGWIAGTANSTIRDYSFYENSYYLEVFGRPIFEPGYSLLSLIFRNMGFQYSYFRLFICIVSSIIIYCALSIFTEKKSMFVILYGIGIFWLDAIQIRTFLAMSLIIFGCSQLLSDSKFKYVRSIFIIFLSAQIHSLGYIFLIFPLVFKMKKDHISNVTWPSFVVVGFIIIIINKTGISSFATTLSKMLSQLLGNTQLAEKVGSIYTYGSNTTNLYLLFFSSYFISAIGRHFLNKYKEKISEKEAEKYKLISLVLSFSFFLVPLSVFAIDYSRIQRISGIFFLIIASVVLSESDIVENTKILFVYFLFVFSFMYIWALFPTIGLLLKF